MSPTDDRIPVPSNGHRPAAKRPTTVRASAPPAASPATSKAGSKAAAASGASAADDGRSEPRIIVTPGHATAVGFGIIAALIVLLLGRRRGRRG